MISPRYELLSTSNPDEFIAMTYESYPITLKKINEPLVYLEKCVFLQLHACALHCVAFVLNYFKEVLLHDSFAEVR